MPQYELTIPPENQQFHLDLEGDMSQRKSGLFSFVIRVHAGLITDYSLFENVEAKTKYAGLIVKDQLVISTTNRSSSAT